MNATFAHSGPNATSYQECANKAVLVIYEILEDDFSESPTKIFLSNFFQNLEQHFVKRDPSDDTRLQVSWRSDGLFPN